MLILDFSGQSSEKSGGRPYYSYLREMEMDVQVFKSNSMKSSQL